MVARRGEPRVAWCGAAVGRRPRAERERCSEERGASESGVPEVSVSGRAAVRGPGFAGSRLAVSPRAPPPRRPVSAAPWPRSLPVEEGSLAPHAGPGEMCAPPPAGVGLASRPVARVRPRPPGSALPRRRPAGRLGVVRRRALRPGAARGLAALPRQWVGSRGPASPRREADGVGVEAAVVGRRPAGCAEGSGGVSVVAARAAPRRACRARRLPPHVAARRGGAVGSSPVSLRLRALLARPVSGSTASPLSTPRLRPLPSPPPSAATASGRVATCGGGGGVGRVRDGGGRRARGARDRAGGRHRVCRGLSRAAPPPRGSRGAPCCAAPRPSPAPPLSLSLLRPPASSSPRCGVFPALTPG